MYPLPPLPLSLTLLLLFLLLCGVACTSSLANKHFRHAESQEEVSFCSFRSCKYLLGRGATTTAQRPDCGRGALDIHCCGENSLPAISAHRCALQQQWRETLSGSKQGHIKEKKKKERGAQEEQAHFLCFLVRQQQRQKNRSLCSSGLCSSGAGELKKNSSGAVGRAQNNFEAELQKRRKRKRQSNIQQPDKNKQPLF